MQEIDLNNLNVVPLDQTHRHLLGSFHSGNAYLDGFMHRGEAYDVGFGRTYLWLTKSNDTICGYYNLSTGYIEQLDEDRRVRAGGSIHVNGFALDEKWRGHVLVDNGDGDKITLADVLLDECLKRIEKFREQIGFSFVTLCATKEGYSLYARNNFYPLESDMAFVDKQHDNDSGTPMYMPLDY